MNTQNRKLLTAFCFIVLVTACSNDPKIMSSTSDRVVIDAPAEKFLDAYNLAKKECEKNTKTAHYIADDSSDLDVVAFNCIGQEEDVVAEATSEESPAAETNTEVPAEINAEEKPVQ